MDCHVNLGGAETAHLRAYPIEVMRMPKHGSTPQHRHDFQELVIIVDGKGTHWVEDEQYPIEAGDTFVILGAMRHGYLDPENLSLINILYDMRRLSLPLADLGTLPGYHALFNLEPQVRRQGKYQNRLRLSVEDLTEALGLVTELEDELASEVPGHHFLANAHLMRLIGFLSRRYSQLEPAGNRAVERLSKLLGHMEKNYDKPLSVKEMTQLAHMSQSALMQTFKRLLGHSPLEHLIRLRVSHAKRLLRQSDLPLAVIAERTGFCDSNYLSRQFRQIVGVPPSEYRGHHY